MRCGRVRRAAPLLGTLVEIAVTGRGEDQLHDSVTAAFADIARVHELMSVQSAASDIFRLNNAPVGAVTQVDAHTWRVLELAASISEASDGVFDITVGAEMMARGDIPQMVSRAPDAHATYRDIELLPEHCVRVRRALATDVSGIAKGYAVDSAVRVLRELGVRSGCVNAGGDLRAFGDETVPVRVRDPLDPSVARVEVDLRNGALATSACYRPDHAFNAAGVVLDPRVAQAVPAGRSASVRAESCAVADALAKCVLVLGHGSASLLHRFQADGFLIEEHTATVIEPSPAFTHSRSLDAAQYAAGQFDHESARAGDATGGRFGAAAS